MILNVFYSLGYLISDLNDKRLKRFSSNPKTGVNKGKQTLESSIKKLLFIKVRANLLDHKII